MVFQNDASCFFCKTALLLLYAPHFIMPQTYRSMSPTQHSLQPYPVHCQVQIVGAEGFRQNGKIDRKLGTAS